MNIITLTKDYYQEKDLM